MTTETPTEYDPEAHAGETIELYASVTRLEGPGTTCTGKVSGTGKTVAVTHDNRPKTVRLNAEDLFTRGWACRNSYTYELVDGGA